MRKINEDHQADITKGRMIWDEITSAAIESTQRQDSYHNDGTGPDHNIEDYIFIQYYAWKENPLVSYLATYQIGKNCDRYNAWQVSFTELTKGQFKNQEIQFYNKREVLEEIGLYLEEEYNFAITLSATSLADTEAEEKSQKISHMAQGMAAAKHLGEARESSRRIALMAEKLEEAWQDGVEMVNSRFTEVEDAWKEGIELVNSKLWDSSAYNDRTRFNPPVIISPDSNQEIVSIGDNRYSHLSAYFVTNNDDLIEYLISNEIGFKHKSGDHAVDVVGEIIRLGRDYPPIYGDVAEDIGNKFCDYLDGFGIDDCWIELS